MDVKIETKEAEEETLSKTQSSSSPGIEEPQGQEDERIMNGLKIKASSSSSEETKSPQKTNVGDSKRIVHFG